MMPSNKDYVNEQCNLINERIKRVRTMMIEDNKRRYLRVVARIVGVVILYIAIMFITSFIFKTMDSAWECRAKSAGYYETLPDNLKNPKDVK